MRPLLHIDSKNKQACKANVLPKGANLNRRRCMESEATVKRNKYASYGERGK